MRPPQSIAARALLATLGGLLVGVLTFYGQGVLPFGLSGIIANSGASWSFFGFLLVAWLVPQHPWWPAVAGAGALVMEVVGYYAIAWVHLGSQNLYAPAVWAACGLLGGPVFGVCAVWWRSDVVWRQVVGIAVMAGLWLGEGLWILLVVMHSSMSPARGWVPIAIGLVLPFVLGRRWPVRWAALAAALLVAGVFYALFNLIPL